jgi:phosphoglycerate-specific signal transduction histidine kinase
MEKTKKEKISKLLLLCFLFISLISFILLIALSNYEEQIEELKEELQQTKINLMYCYEDVSIYKNMAYEYYGCCEKLKVTESNLK